MNHPSNPKSNTRPDSEYIASISAQLKEEQKRIDEAKKRKDELKKIKELQNKNDVLIKEDIVQWGIIMAEYLSLLKDNPGATLTTRTNWLNAYKKAETAWKKAQADVKTNQEKIAALTKESYNTLASQGLLSHNSYLAQKNFAKNQQNSNLTPPPGPELIEKPFKYNAPMVKSAYMNPVGPQGSSSTDGKLISDPGAFKNAGEAWKGVTPSKGVLQMSKLFASQAIPQYNADNNGTVKTKTITPYGFKFLYNPTDVSMAWGIVDSFSPEYVASGQSQLSAVSIGLMKSTINFSLILNRIGDMAFVSETGIRREAPTAYLARNAPVIDSDKAYPTLVAEEELASIYRRGTMYDLEYLFRAMGAGMGDYESSLNGTTADRGWLQPIPLELHLGAGLRYLVRISSLDVKHIMFNERMVPTLTTATITCTRYYDSPEAFNNTVFAPESGASTITTYQEAKTP